MKKTKSIVKTVSKLIYVDEELARMPLPNGEMKITRGIGSGLCKRQNGENNRFWSIGDRGPNFKPSFAFENLGLSHFKKFLGSEGVKIMPFPHIGPAISEFVVETNRITCVRTFSIKDLNGEAISGLPSNQNSGETAVDMDGNPIDTLATGMDSEGIAAMNDGTFWIADEYCPSLVQTNAQGNIIQRLIPIGLGHLFECVNYEIREVLPQISSKRQFNRGFEAITASIDEKWLYVAFQSPLAHPNETAHKNSKYVRIWKIDTETGEVAAQYLYKLDKALSFARDNELGKFKNSDIKISELVTISKDRLLVLERGSATSKFYTVSLSKKYELDEKHLNIATTPTIEQLIRSELKTQKIETVPKSLVFSTDDYPQIDADLEGVLLLSPNTLLVVNDNDFGVEGKTTQFWKIELTNDL
ncbi:MAG: Uncharacterized protein FD163_866 [Hyphomonadaceae bacterium]|nr:MAG: Uncharacterized protein FD128_1860 [Hyphomonadaceae bacterium]KAF0186198.1 MAG: Uncharacterized protein FD163_866 [Hyphomonadaceae bacterium]